MSPFFLDCFNPILLILAGVKTGCYGLVRCQSDETWSTLIRCLPINSIGPPITTRLPPTTSIGLTTGSNSAATTIAGRTYTDTGSPKTTGPLWKLFASVSTGSSLTATSTAGATSADISRPAGTITEMAGFSREPGTTFFGGVTISVSPGITSTPMSTSSTTNTLTTSTTTSTTTHSIPSSSTTGTEASTSSSTPGRTLSTKNSRTTVSSMPTPISERNMTAVTRIPLASMSKGASATPKTTSPSLALTTINMVLTTINNNFAAKSSPTTTGHTGSAASTNKPSDITESRTSMQQFSQTSPNTGTVSNTNEWQGIKTLGKTSSSTTEVNSQPIPIPTHSTVRQHPSQNSSSKTTTAKAFTTMKSTLGTTISLQDSRQSTTKMFNASSSLVSTTVEIFITTAPPTELVVTSPPTERTPQHKISPDEHTGSTQQSQGSDQLAMQGNDKISDGMIGYIALVSGIGGAVGIAVLLPLLVFVLKSLCTAAKVAPNAGLFESSPDEYVVTENERTTNMLSHV